MSVKVLEVLKGGSLGKTELIETSFGELRVRKSISSVMNREYGEVRWHSQLKRLQRYKTLVPELFPKILELGTTKDSYFFDIEYFDGFCNLKTYFCDHIPTREQINFIANRIVVYASRLHTYTKFDSYPGSISVYFQEEVIQKISDARKDPKFNFVTESPFITFNGVSYPSLQSQVAWLRNFVSQVEISNECFTHGNLTLENILIHPISLEIKFIDPYDENIVDCKESDFSQILQCSSTHYGLMSDFDPIVDGASVAIKYDVPLALIQFNQVILRLFSSSELSLNSRLLDFLHVSQFVRMLPFKIQSGNLNKGILFYALSCKLVEEMRRKYGD
jgi:hypothetical protein